MRTHEKLIAGLKAGSAALLLFVAAGTITGSPFSGMVAYADTLTADQTAAITTMMQTALANIDPSLTGQARQLAVQQALAQVMTSAIQTYGTAAISTVAGAAVTSGIPVAQVVAGVLPVAASSAGTSTAVANIVLGAIQAGGSASDASQAAIVVAAQSQLSNTEVGSGLGTAAAQLAQSNPTAANQIAAAVANEGTPGMSGSFSTAVLQNGGSQQLADAGSAPPSVTGGIANPNVNVPGVPGATGNALGTSSTNLPPCTNPSCT